MFTRGLVSSHAGNLSIRMGDRLVITRRGSQLGSLKECDLIETGITRNDRFTPLASTELAVHRAIYMNTSASAIVHAHPPHAVALSLTGMEIIPDIAEGIASFGHVPVLGQGGETKPGILADEISEALQKHRLVMVRGHGSFAIGQLLEEAYGSTTAFEESCQVTCLLKSLKPNQASE